MKRGQISIFVIISLFAIAAISLIIFLNSRSSAPSINVGDEFEVENFIRSCIRDTVSEKSEQSIIQGGFYEPTNYVLYDDVKATYLCENVNYYESCINQYPLYISEISDDLKQAITADVANCFVLLEQELEVKNYEISSSPENINVVLKPGIIQVEVEKNMSVSLRDVSRSYELFVSQTASPLYDLAFVAQEIVSQEARSCYFEYVGFSLLYPKYSIKKYTLSDSTKIYTISHKATGKNMNIAVRGCAIPAGF